MSSVTRRIARNIRRHDADAPNARADARTVVHPIVDRLLTDRELHAAPYRRPLVVQRSRAKSREWARRIEQRLNVPEHVRLAFGGAR